MALKLFIQNALLGMFEIGKKETQGIKGTLSPKPISKYVIQLWTLISDHCVIDLCKFLGNSVCLKSGYRKRKGGLKTGYRK